MKTQDNIVNQTIYLSLPREMITRNSRNTERYGKNWCNHTRGLKIPRSVTPDPTSTTAKSTSHPPRPSNATRPIEARPYIRPIETRPYIRCRYPWYCCACCSWHYPGEWRAHAGRHGGSQNIRLARV